MQLIHRFRIPALFCSLAVLVCELVSYPYANMGICDDWSYILSTQKLAATGHIVYVGWSAAMLGWQLYLGAAFIKLFGPSLTTVRMSTLLVALVLAFVLQRTMVRANINERNAIIGTLALVLSPLYLMLSVTFMSDIEGLFAVVLCIYGCIRALQAATSGAAIGWLCFAVATNAICGTSRQIAWLGVLVMVPSALWLMRTQRRVFLAGAVATLAGTLFIFACMYWFKQQPYTLPEHFLVGAFPVAQTLREIIYFFLDVPFLILPLIAVFLPEIRKSRHRTIVILFALLLGYFFLAIYPSNLRRSFPLEPTIGDWINFYGVYSCVPKGGPPIFLHGNVRVLLTIASLGGLIGFIASLLCSVKTSPAHTPTQGVSWKQLGVLLAPFTIAYTLLLIYRAVTIANAGTPAVLDRYALGLAVVALLFLVRYYQDRIQTRLPLACVLLVGIMAIYGVSVTHNTFSLYRARVTIAAEIRAAGIPDTSVDNGWDYNMRVELQHAHSINDPLIVVPPHFYVPRPPAPVGTCEMAGYDQTPHIHPLYGVSFDPNACYGPAPFTPVHYSRWLASNPGTLYVVRYTASSKP